MLKRILTSLTIIFACAAAALAAGPTGSWTIIPVSGEFSHIVDTGDMVWYVTGGRLNSYSRSADETRTYDVGTQLSDFTVSALYHGAGKEYVTVVYDNSNIDLVYPDGTVANLPDIRDASVNADKTVNDVAFHDNLIYVATGFGMVIFDDERLEVKESGIYNGHGLLWLGATDAGLMVVPDGYNEGASPLLLLPWGERIHKYANYRVLREDAGGRFTHLLPLGGNRVAALQWGNVKCLTLINDATDVSFGTIFTGSRSPSLMPASDGGFYFATQAGQIRRVNTDATLDPRSWTLPADIAGNLLCTYTGPDKSLWAADDNGLGEYAIADDGSVTVKRRKSVPAVATSFAGVCRLFPDATGEGFIISNLGQNMYHPVGNGDRMNVRLNANHFSGGTYTTIRHEGVSAVTSTGISYQKSLGKYIFSPTYIVQDPDIPARYFIASALEGVYVMEDGKQITVFNPSNSPLFDRWAYMATYVGIDHQGNLWMFNYSASPQAFMLPAAKRRSDLTAITKDDWVAVDFGGNINFKDIRVVFCRHSNFIITFDAWETYAIEAIQHNGNIADVAAHKSIGWASVIDSDGKKFQPSYWMCAAEDKRGQVWIGTSSGVVVIPDPQSVMTPSFTVNRVKVPRNDGTNLADYLLETDKIHCIAVDHSNRKWIGTEDSGLYLVSENGDEILAVYNTSNSPLPTNTITGLHVDIATNTVYVATLSGMFEFQSTSGPAAPDFSSAYAYPNPVTPGHTGWITIAGLMDNSLVKIVDSGMHLVHQTTSEGGTAVWDGCDLNGSRVRSGVYYVMASSGSDTSSEAAVATKILVVN